MKRYSFRLESVLRTRNVIEEQRRSDLVEAQTMLRAAHAEWEDRIDQLAEERRRNASSALRSGRDLQANHDQHARHHRAIALARHAREVAADHVSTTRFAWSDAKSEVAKLERLDANHRDVWRSEVSKADQVATDEVATTRFSRKGFA